MHWIALQPPEAERQPWIWQGLRFTPRVAEAGPALLLEVEASLRLWGGAERLRARLLAPEALAPLQAWAEGGTARVALALLQLALRGQSAPQDLPGGLPLDTLEPARPHLDWLAHLGARHWRDLRRLPRGPLAQRLGGEFIEALDQAWGERPEVYPWCQAPAVFDLRLELPALATAAPELLHAAHRLLGSLQAWLGARQQGVLAIELEWALDLRRLNGVPLPPTESVQIRTARPTQDMAHLRRLLAERLARTALAASAHTLRLRSLETVPWAGESTSLLPEDRVQGEPLHAFIERASERLGEHQVLVAERGLDHRPERMQRWVPARRRLGPARRPGADDAAWADALFPTWLLPEPVPLKVIDERPHHGGPLRLLTRAWRVRTAWWEGTAIATATATANATANATPTRDYFVARSPTAGLLWVFRERVPAGAAPGARVQRWFLHGLYG